MKKLLFASHGNLAKEIIQSAQLILGGGEELAYISMGPGTSMDEVKNKILRFLESGSKEDEYVILTDVFGGSITNVCTEYLIRPHVYVVSGFNLPFVLELLSADKTQPVEPLIEHCMEQARTGIVFVNRLIENHQ